MPRFEAVSIKPITGDERRVIVENYLGERQCIIAPCFTARNQESIDAVVKALNDALDPEPAKEG